MSFVILLMRPKKENIKSSPRSSLKSYSGLCCVDQEVFMVITICIISYGVIISPGGAIEQSSSDLPPRE